MGVSIDFKYVRIEGRELAPNTMRGNGVFSMWTKLLRGDVMEAGDADLLKFIDEWFSENLPWPEPCKNQENVICFFKAENADEMMKMIKPGLWLLDKYNHPYYVVYTNDPGEIVYEDKYQIVVKSEPVIGQLMKSWTPADK